MSSSATSSVAVRKEFGTQLEALLTLLVAFGPGNDVLANPWVDEVTDFDLPGSAAQRVQNLRQYFLIHERAKVVLVGQEAGYAGCRFSGVPFTGEDLLEGPKTITIFANQGMRHTSAFPKRMSERSANIVWPVIGGGGHAVLWNSLPFHCHERRLPLTNRAWTPRDDRNGLAEKILRHVIEKMYPRIPVVAVGKKAHACLTALGFESTCVRHPSQGGATQFREQMAEVFERLGIAPEPLRPS